MVLNPNNIPFAPINLSAVEATALRNRTAFIKTDRIEHLTLLALQVMTRGSVCFNEGKVGRIF